jgi:hypothetical protein
MQPETSETRSARQPAALVLTETEALFQLKHLQILYSVVGVVIKLPQ